MAASRIPGPLGVEQTLWTLSLPQPSVLGQGFAPGPIGYEPPKTSAVQLPTAPISLTEQISLLQMSIHGDNNVSDTGSTKVIAWGAKVSAEFKDKVISIADELGIDPSYLMAAMAFESGETFSPSVKNSAGSGAVGLIQFMPQTAIALDTTTENLAKMSAVAQLDYVREYFLPYKGKLSTLADVYMVILWPAAIGKPDAYVLFSKADTKHPKRYLQNKGLDKNHDGAVSKSEAASAVQAKLKKGQQVGFAG